MPASGAVCSAPTIGASKRSEKVPFGRAFTGASCPRDGTACVELLQPLLKNTEANPVLRGKGPVPELCWKKRLYTDMPNG